MQVSLVPSDNRGSRAKQVTEGYNAVWGQLRLSRPAAITPGPLLPPCPSCILLHRSFLLESFLIPPFTSARQLSPNGFHCSPSRELEAKERGKRRRGWVGLMPIRCTVPRHTPALSSLRGFQCVRFA